MAEQATFMYVGTFPRSNPSDEVDSALGIYVFRLDPSSGNLAYVGLTPTPRPGWVATDPSRRFLYAANEVREFEGQPGGGVSAFAIDSATGKLTPLNTRPASAPGPCHLVVDQTGRYVLVSTYLGGTVSMYPIEADGRLGPASDFHQHGGSSVHPRRQTHAYAHSINLDPANRFALVADLGADRVVVYELDLERGKLRPHPDRDARVAPGSGPRHMAFHPNSRFVYLLNEMGGTITSFAYDAARGTSREIQAISTLPDGFTGFRSTAEIALHPGGRFLYCTNRSIDSSNDAVRGEDTIAWYAIDGTTGLLSPRGRVHTGGEVPRNFTIDPSGTRLYVANQRSSNIVTFAIDPDSGALTPTGQITPTPIPVCLHIVTPG